MRNRNFMIRKMCVLFIVVTSIRVWCISYSVFYPTSLKSHSDRSTDYSFLSLRQPQDKFYIGYINLRLLNDFMRYRSDHKKAE